MITTINEVWDFLEQNGFKILPQSFNRLYGLGGARNVRQIHKSNKQGILYVKFSNLEDGFWGIGKNEIDALRKVKYPWAVILLKDSVTTGYYFDSDLVAELADKRQWSSDAQDYKVHENQEGEIGSSVFFDNLAGILGHIEKILVEYKKL